MSEGSGKRNTINSQDVIKNIKNLSSLMEDNSWQSIVRKIASNDPDTTEAVLAHKSYDEKVAEALADALSNNSNLKALKIGGNNFQDSGSKKILDSIIKNPQSSVTHLDISFNGISSRGIDYLISQLSNSKHKFSSIVTLGNSVDNEQTEAIMRLMDGEPLINPVQRTNSERSKKKKKDKSDRRKTEKSDERRKTDRGDERKTKKKKRKTQRDDGSVPNSPHSGGNTYRFTSVEHMRVALLEKQIEELRSSEKDYQSHIELLELRAEKLFSLSGSGDRRSSSGRNIVNKIFKEKSKKLTVSVGNPIVTHKLAATGGSNAGVYSCIVDGWQCAMKELDLSDMDEYTVNNFQSEIRILELLPPHDNIARYLFHELKDNKLRLYMTQYSSSLGSQISKRKKESKKFSPSEISSFLIDVINGIDFLHAQGIVHRDLKSDNVFVLLDEKNVIISCAIGDFDTAKQIIGEKAAKAMTVLGTPSWMAPEVMNARDAGEYSFPCDIYSFGMIIYELLSLKIPYEDVNPMQVPLLVTQGKRPQLPSDLGEDFTQLVNLYERCTLFDPHKRPDASTVKQVIANILATARISFS